MPQVIYPFFLTIADGRIYIVESDAYLLSSFFRHISKDMKRIARFVNLSFSESDLFKGEEYLSPFIKDIMNILKKI